MARTDIAQALGLEYGASDVEMVAAATQLSTENTERRRVFDAAPKWITDSADLLGATLRQVLRLPEGAKVSEVIAAVEEIFKYETADKPGPKARALAAAVFSAMVASTRRAEPTLSHEAAQREVARSYPELFAAVRAAPANDDASRSIATSMLRAAAASIAKREGVSLEESQRRAATEYPEIYAASRGGGR